MIGLLAKNTKVVYFVYEGCILPEKYFWQKNLRAVDFVREVFLKKFEKFEGRGSLPQIRNELFVLSFNDDPYF